MRSKGPHNFIRNHYETSSHLFLKTGSAEAAESNRIQVCCIDRNGINFHAQLFIIFMMVLINILYSSIKNSRD